MKKVPYALVFGVVALVIFAAYTGYVLYAKSSATNQLETLKSSVADYQNQLTQLQNEHIEQAVSAKKLMDELSMNSIMWSEVIKEIQKTIPQIDSKTQMIDILSYSGSSDNRVSMNMKTVPKSTSPYFDVAQLIQSFDENANFSDNFVPSISSGLDQNGSAVLTFMLSTKYVGGAEDVGLESGPKVPSTPDSEKKAREEDKPVAR